MGTLCQSCPKYDFTQKSAQYLIQTQRHALDADDVDPDSWPLINLNPAATSCSQYITPNVSLLQIFKCFPPPDVSSTDSHPRIFLWTPTDVSPISSSTGYILSAYNVNWIPRWLQNADSHFRSQGKANICIQRDFPSTQLYNFHLPQVNEGEKVRSQWVSSDLLIYWFIDLYPTLFIYTAGKSILQNVKHWYYWKCLLECLTRSARRKYSQLNVWENLP